MYNFVGGNNKSSAQKWLRPSNQEEFEDDFDEYEDYRSYRNTANRAASGTSTTGPVKVINNQQQFQTGSGRPGSAVRKQETGQSSLPGNNNSTGLITRSKVFDLGINPKRLALSYQIPTIIIEYLVPNSGKLYHHRIKIRELKANSDQEKVLKQIKRRHEMYLSKISDNQLLKLIDQLQQNLQNDDSDSNKEPSKPIDKSSAGKENKSDQKPANIINPFSKNKNITDSQISMEEKELCARLKNQFQDEEDDEDENEFNENQNEGQEEEEDEQNQKENSDQDEQNQEEEDDNDNDNNDKDEDDDSKGAEDNKNQKEEMHNKSNEKDKDQSTSQQNKSNRDDHDDYDYDFDEYTEQDNDTSNKHISQDISQLSNSNNDYKIPAKQQAADFKKDLIDSKLNKEYIHSKPIVQSTKVVYDDELNFSDQGDDDEQEEDSQKDITNSKGMEESDGYRDFDVDTKAIYQHHFTRNPNMSKNKPQDKSQYSDENGEDSQEEQERGEYDDDEEGEEYNENQGEQEEGEEGEENEEDQDNIDDDDEYDLEDIDDLRLSENKKEATQMKSPQRNNFMGDNKVIEKQDAQPVIEKKQLSDDKMKAQVKFEQTLSSKKPEMQIKPNQPSAPVGSFITKKNNFVDADEGIDLDDEDDDQEGNEDDDFQMDFNAMKNRQTNEDEYDYEEDEEDLYSQVKKKLGTIQQKEPSSNNSDYKANLQQKKYELAYYQNQAQQQYDKGAYNGEDDDEDEEEGQQQNQNNKYGNDEDDENFQGEKEDGDYGIEGEEEYEGEEEGEFEDDEFEIDDIDLDDQYQVQQANQKYRVPPPQQSSSSSKNQNNTNNNQKANLKNQQNMFDELEDELEENLDNLVDYNSYDLNKLTSQDLDKVKKEMDKKFEKNRKKPNDVDFVYDLRESFDGNESNQWDVSQSQDKHDMEQVDYDIV